MPYPNEHSARLRNPGDFDPKTFHRVNDGTIYGHIKVPQTIAVIWGKLKTESTKTDNPIPQALRFPIKNWTAEQARKWIKDNNIKYISFIPASNKENNSMESQTQFAVWTTKYINNLPDSAFLYIKPGGQKDADGKTVPRTLRYFPYKDAGGNIDLPHLRNAIARIPQSDLSQSLKDALQAKAKKILEKENSKTKHSDIQSHEELQWKGNNQVSDKFCQFICENALSFSDSLNKNIVRLTGYRGDITKHPFWGNLALDMKGLYFDKKITPGLIDHDTSKRLTFSQQQNISPETFIEGPFLDNKEALELNQDMKKGFPFQASLFVKPEIVEQVQDGSQVEVNGQMLKGPGAVFRKAAIKEISAVVFGAFNNTESTSYKNKQNENYQFELVNKEKNMSKQDQTNQMTIEEFITDYPELNDQIFESGKSSGINSEKDRFILLQKACGDDAALLVKCFIAGKSPADATAMKLDMVQAEAKRLADENAALKAKKVDPAINEFRDTTPPPGSAPAKFDEASSTNEQLKEHFSKTKELQDQFTSADAYIAVVKHPAKK
jgi:hypothetical protein